MQVLIRAVENEGVAAPIMRGTDHARNHNPLSPCLSGIELDPSINPGARRCRPRGSCQVHGRMRLMRESRSTPNHKTHVCSFGALVSLKSQRELASPCSTMEAKGIKKKRLAFNKGQRKGLLFHRWRTKSTCTAKREKQCSMIVRLFASQPIEGRPVPQYYSPRAL